MQPTIQVGTILLKQWAGMPQLAGVETEPCSGDWSFIKGWDSTTLDRKTRAAGWNFFFLTAKVRATFLGLPETLKVQNALKRILEKVKPQHFNGLEVTGIVAGRFLGVPYVTVSAHSRHMQQSCYLESPAAREASQADAEWAQG